MACRAVALMFHRICGPLSPLASARQPAFFTPFKSESWSGRDLPAGCVAGDLNAPEAHKYAEGAQVRRRRINLHKEFAFYPPMEGIRLWWTPTLIPMCQATYVLDRTSEIFLLSWLVCNQETLRYGAHRNPLITDRFLSS